MSNPRNSVPRALRVIAEAAIFVGALTVLYLAFRGSPVHPPAKAAPAAAGPSSSSAAGGLQTGQGTSVEPAAVAPPPTPATTAAPTESPGAGTSQTGVPFGVQAQSYLAGRRGSTEMAVYDLSTGRQWALGPQAPQTEESAVRLEILQAVLNQRKVKRTVLSLTEQELAPPMIEQNDNDATTTLWEDVGGAKGMRAFDHAARLMHTSPSEPGWGQTTSTPQDQITLLRQLARPSGVLDSNSQKYALSLLDAVIPAQRWGVSSGVPAGVTVALANGGGPLNAGKSDWQVNSVGWVSGDGRNYLMAVLSTGNPSSRYGTATLNHLGAMVWSALAPR